MNNQNPDNMQQNGYYPQQPQGNYPPPNGYYSQPQPPKQPVSGCSVTAMILGIVALLFSCCFYYVSIPCAIIGCILAAVGIKSGKGGKGMGIAGLVMSIISLVPSIIVIATGAALFSSLGF